MLDIRGNSYFPQKHPKKNVILICEVILDITHKFLFLFLFFFFNDNLIITIVEKMIFVLLKRKGRYATELPNTFDNQ